MKKYLLFIALFCTSTCFAFPSYNNVYCRGLVNGHTTIIQYNKQNHILILNVDGEQAAGYANEAGNRIYTNPEYDEDGVSWVFDIVSNSSNWQATFNIYANNQSIYTTTLNCQRMGLTMNSEQQKSATSLISKFVK